MPSRSHGMPSSSSTGQAKEAKMTNTADERVHRPLREKLQQSGLVRGMVENSSGASIPPKTT